MENSAKIFEIIVGDPTLKYTLIAFLALTLISFFVAVRTAIKNGSSITLGSLKITNQNDNEQVNIYTNHDEKEQLVALKETELPEIPHMMRDREHYYQNYFRTVRNAQKSLDMIGDGFSCHKAKNKEYAEGLISAIDHALANNPELIARRFQYSSTLSLYWLQKLLELKKKYGDRFILYLNEDYDPKALPFAVVITDRNTSDTTVNIMFTRSSDTTLKEKTAGPAFIFEQAKNIHFLSDYMYQSIAEFFDNNFNKTETELARFLEQLTNSRRSVVDKFISTLDEISLDSTSLQRIAENLNILDLGLIKEVLLEKLHENQQLYFAYGSNMLFERIYKRCNSVVEIGVARLPEHTLTFDIPGSKGEGASGGVANIKKSPNNSVYGVLYQLTRDELRFLNELEISMGYSVKAFTVIYNDLEIKCTAYIAEDLEEKHIPPSVPYSQLISQGIKRDEIPEHYQNAINHLMLQN